MLDLVSGCRTRKGSGEVETQRFERLVEVMARMAGKGVPYDVWLVRFDPKIENVPIARGENSGLTLPHRNVVKQLVKLGVWKGSAADFALPAAAQSGLRDAVLVQKGPGGAVVAAVKSE